MFYLINKCCSHFPLHVALLFRVQLLYVYIPLGQEESIIVKQYQNHIFSLLSRTVTITFCCVSNQMCLVAIYSYYSNLFSCIFNGHPLLYHLEYILQNISYSTLSFYVVHPSHTLFFAIDIYSLHFYYLESNFLYSYVLLGQEGSILSYESILSYYTYSTFSILSKRVSYP